MAANKANKFAKITVTRSEAEVSSFTDLRFCLTMSNPVPEKSLLTILYPKDQALLQNQQTYRAEGQTLTVTASDQKAIILIP